MKLFCTTVSDIETTDVKWTLRDIGILFFLSYIIIFFVSLLFLQAVKKNLYLGAFLHNIIFLVAIHVVLRIRSAKWSSLGFVRKNLIKTFMLGVLVGTGLFLLLKFLLYSSEGLNWFSSKHNIFLVYIFLPFTFTGLVSGIFTPVVEEIFFRGMMCQVLWKKWGIVSAIFISSTVFGISHLLQGIREGIVAFFLGICLAYIFYKTKSIFLSIWVHVTINYHALAFYIMNN